MVTTRRPLWLVWLVGAAVLAGAAVYLLVGGREPLRPKPATASADQRFRSRPDLRPPVMTVETLRPGTAPGLVLLTPKRRNGQMGPAILDRRGELVWFKPMKPEVRANDLRVQRYRGRPVLTWWEGLPKPQGAGAGTWVIADRSYREIARVRAGNGLDGDLHDMVLTARGTALITAYDVVDTDLSVIGSPPGGKAVDSIIQEVDVHTGKVLWEWHSIDHVALAEAYPAPPKTHRMPYDYFHINSVAEDPDGNLIVSGRNTWAIYKIDRSTGKVIWRLGGRRSDFALGKGVRFAWQHDVRLQPDGTLTVFDNQATPRVGDESRALVLAIDERRRTVRLVRAFTHPDNVLSIAEGNAQALPGGGMFVGWGMARRVSEFGADGRLRFDLRLPSDTDSYRAVRMPWTGRPAERPRLAVERSGEDVTAYASWNGATGVTRWELLAGDSRRRLAVVAAADRTGFETAIKGKTSAPWIAVRALAGGRVLAMSAPVRG